MPNGGRLVSSLPSISRPLSCGTVRLPCASCRSQAPTPADPRRLETGSPKARWSTTLKPRPCSPSFVKRASASSRRLRIRPYEHRATAGAAHRQDQHCTFDRASIEQDSGEVAVRVIVALANGLNLKIRAEESSGPSNWREQGGRLRRRSRGSCSEPIPPAGPGDAAATRGAEPAGGGERGAPEHFRELNFFRADLPEPVRTCGSWRGSEPRRNPVGLTPSPPSASWRQANRFPWRSIRVTLLEQSSQPCSRTLEGRNS